MSYDAFATTFSNSRKQHPWPELDAIIEDMEKCGYKSVLDIGCGNGRFLEQIENWKLKIDNYLGTDSSEWMIQEAQELHPRNTFYPIAMEDISKIIHYPLSIIHYDSLLFLASFHHLDTREKRLQTLRDAQAFLSPHGRIYMTCWNLRDQERYDSMKTSDGEYQIKIWAHSRYYHAFTLTELEELFLAAGYRVIENKIFDGGRNLYSILSL